MTHMIAGLPQKKPGKRVADLTADRAALGDAIDILNNGYQGALPGALRLPLSSGKRRGFGDQCVVRANAGIERKLLHGLQSNHFRAADNVLVQALRQLD